MTAQMQTAHKPANWSAPAGAQHTQSSDTEQKLRHDLIADAAGIADWQEDALADAQMTTRPKPKRADLDIQARALLHALNLGRIAIDVLAPTTSKTLAVIGSTPEAEAQIAAAFAHRDFTDVRIYARQPVAATALAKKFRDLVQKPIDVCASPEQAVHRADVIILATNAARPVIDADWVMQGVHITCAFPQELHHHELPKMLLSRARIVASECPQNIGINAQHLMSGLKTSRRVIHLGAMIDRFNPDRQRGMTVFFMAGDGQTRNKIGGQ